MGAQIEMFRLAKKTKVYNSFNPSKLSRPSMNTIYNQIGCSYSVTRKADPNIALRLAQLLGVEEGKRYLDLACGSGNYTNALSLMGGSWCGVDISKIMLDQAKTKNTRIDWQLANANELPYKNKSFDGVICTLAIHHLQDVPAVFKEVGRVLKTGRFVIFTAFPAQMERYWLNYYFPEMMKNSRLKMPDEKFIVQALISAGFFVESQTQFQVSNQLQDLFLYSGKQRPALYLDSLVRTNISSFASDCSEAELSKGLHLLKEDLATGKFDQVAGNYNSDIGDYVFISSLLR